MCWPARERRLIEFTFPSFLLLHGKRSLIMLDSYFSVEFFIAAFMALVLKLAEIIYVGNDSEDNKSKYPIEFPLSTKTFKLKPSTQCNGLLGSRDNHRKVIIN